MASRLGFRLIASDLLLERADRGIQRSQAAFRGITPAGEQPQLVRLVVLPGLAWIEGGGTEAKGWKHAVVNGHEVRF